MKPLDKGVILGLLKPGVWMTIDYLRDLLRKKGYDVANLRELVEKLVEEGRLVYYRGAFTRPGKIERPWFVTLTAYRIWIAQVVGIERGPLSMPIFVLKVVCGSGYPQGFKIKFTPHIMPPTIHYELRMLADRASLWREFEFWATHDFYNEAREELRVRGLSGSVLGSAMLRLRHAIRRVLKEEKDIFVAKRKLEKAFEAIKRRYVG